MRREESKQPATKPSCFKSLVDKVKLSTSKEQLQSHKVNLIPDSEKEEIEKARLKYCATWVVIVAIHSIITLPLSLISGSELTLVIYLELTLLAAILAIMLYSFKKDMIKVKLALHLTLF